MPAARCAGEGQVGGADAGGGFYCSVYLLYWYKKITKKKAQMLILAPSGAGKGEAGGAGAGRGRAGGVCDGPGGGV
jgi:hypothetical protein